MIGHEGKSYGFDRLFEAVQLQPESVPEMIKEEPELLACENYAGETVLQFFSMEGEFEIVKLLLSCGAYPDDWSVSFACEFAHIDTIILLFEAGGTPNQFSKNRFLCYQPSNFKKKQMKKLFDSYGFEW